MEASDARKKRSCSKEKISPSTGTESTEARKRKPREKISTSAESVQVRRKCSREKFSIETTEGRQRKNKLDGKIKDFKDSRDKKKTKRKKPKGSQFRRKKLSNEKVSGSSGASTPKSDGMKDVTRDKDVTKEDTRDATVENDQKTDNETAGTVFIQIKAPVKPTVSPLMDHRKSNAKKKNTDGHSVDITTETTDHTAESEKKELVKIIIPDSAKENKYKEKELKELNIFPDNSLNNMIAPDLQSIKEPKSVKESKPDVKESKPEPMKESKPKSVKESKPEVKESKPEPVKESKPEQMKTPNANDVDKRSAKELQKNASRDLKPVISYYHCMLEGNPK